MKQKAENIGGLRVVHLADEKQRAADQRVRELTKVLLDKWNRQQQQKYERMKKALALN